ncbi:MAG: choice-of-anchor D domain-containing protein, partial [Bryobacteraceae bacterium]
MIRARLINGFAAVAIAALTIPAQAQTTTPLPFTLRVQQTGAVTPIENNGTIAFNAEAVGRASTAQLGVTYAGATGSTVVVTNVELTGSTDFAVTGVPDATQSFRPTESFGLGVRYTPTSSLKVSGLIRVSYTESPRQGNPVRGSFTINLSGVAPEFAFSYFLQPNGNSSPIAPGGTITFPPTEVLDFNSVTIVITNRGSGPGSVRNITSAGADFVLSGLPLLPVAAVDAGKELRFTVSYEPVAIANSTGSASIEFVERTVTFSLRGNSVGPVFSYDVTSLDTVRAILPGETVALPDAIVSEKSSVVVRVRNTGNFEGAVRTINVAGTGFSLVEQPFLPIIVLPDGSFTITVGFAPAAPGRVQGRLRVGAAEFLLSGNGLGPTLTYAYVSSNVTTSVVNNASVNFPPIAIGQSST